MVMIGPSQGRSFVRLLLAVLSGLVLSWLGVAALITLSVTGHGPVPWVLLVVWAALAVERKRAS